MIDLYGFVVVSVMVSSVLLVVIFIVLLALFIVFNIVNIFPILRGYKFPHNSALPDMKMLLGESVESPILFLLCAFGPMALQDMKA